LSQNREPNSLKFCSMRQGADQAVAFTVDLIERRRPEEAVRQLESDLAHMNRLSMIGELAASPAHEITQPIAAARNNARAAEGHSAQLSGRDKLTARERDVLAMISQGCSNKQIARTFAISPETVKSHVKHIFLKLTVSTRAEAVSRAGLLGLLPHREPAPRPHRDALQRLMGCRGSIGARMTSASGRERLISRARRGGAPWSRF
jgi:DNA-binding CsgD family transcriptional regulator